VIQQGDRNYTVVEFDIAISSSEGLSGGGGVKVVGFFDAGAKGEQSSGTTSRVRFSVPILLPRAKST